MASGGTIVQRAAPAPVYLPPDSSTRSHGYEAPVLSIALVSETDGSVLEVVHALEHDTVERVKLRLRARGCHKIADGQLVFGERSLAEHEVVGVLAAQLQAASGSGAADGSRHIYMRLRDIDAVSLTTRAQRTLSLRSPTADSGGGLDGGSSFVGGREGVVGPRSALTALLDEDSSRSIAAPADSTKAAAAAVSQPLSSGDPIVHLVIRKSAKLDWQLAGSRVELAISAGASAGRLAEHAEAFAGVQSAAGSRLQLLYNGEVLPAGRALSSFGIPHGAVLDLVPVEADALPDGSPTLSSPEHELFEGWRAAREGLAAGSRPRLAETGSGGSYFLSNSAGVNVAVFKPQDEEPGAVSNPRGHGAGGDGADASLRRGVRPGEGAVREVAAYLLDRDHFAGVPPTALVSVQPQAAAPGGSDASETCHKHSDSTDSMTGGAGLGTKVGSLQQFVHAEGDCEDHGPSAFPVHEVHKIAQLDLRMANTDRNGGNILARRGDDGQWQLVPIDHGYTLPSTFADVSFEWLYWPQAKAPFDAVTRAYIASLDADADLATLSAHGLRLSTASARVFKVATLLLRKGAARGLSPRDIGGIMCREEDDARSPIEGMHADALRAAAKMLRSPHETAEDADTDASYVRHMDALLDEFLDDLALTGLTEGSAVGVAA